MFCIALNPKVLEPITQVKAFLCEVKSPFVDVVQIHAADM